MQRRGRSLSWLLGAVVWLLPAVALATTLATSSALFSFDINDGLAGAAAADGTIEDGTSDAYDRCYYLDVNGTRYDQPIGGMATLSLAGRQTELSPTTIGNLSVERRVYVPELVGDWARFTDIVTNIGTSTEMVTMGLSGDVGSDTGTILVSSSSGDAVWDTTDDWFSTDDVDGSGDPSLAHVVQGPGAPVRASATSLAVDILDWDFTFSLAPGERAVILSFAIMKATQAEAQAEATALVALPADALFGIDDVLADIINFAIPPPSCATAEGMPCTTSAGAPGICRSGGCCGGCWDGTSCHVGTTMSECGAGGAACTSCVDDGNPCTSDSCSGGACATTPVPAGGPCDDGMFCTDSDMCDGSGSCVSSPRSCDDGLGCTSDSCNEGTDSCDSSLATGCLIGGGCASAGTLNPASTCQSCDPSRDVSNWSNTAAGIACGSRFCGDGRLTLEPLCDGSGTCVRPPDMPCATGTCAGSFACTAAACTDDAGCEDYEYCEGTRCALRSAAGNSCTMGRQCTSGFCADGYCCLAACDGTCESCGIFGAIGSCIAVADGRDPDDECPGAMSCNGMHGCGAAARDGGAGLDGGVVPRDSGGDGGGPSPDAGADGTLAAAGCGCVVPGARPSGGWAAAVIALGVVLVASIRGRRRRRRGT